MSLRPALLPPPFISLHIFLLTEQNPHRLFQEGETVGSNDYPHTFNNREGFDFAVGGPYQEFPILSSFDPYTGGSPGADRVVFNENGQYAGAITHNGASGNNFVECT